MVTRTERQGSFELNCIDCYYRQFVRNDEAEMAGVGNVDLVQIPIGRGAIIVSEEERALIGNENDKVKHRLHVDEKIPVYR